MKIQAAVVNDLEQEYEIEDVELPDELLPEEVLVKIVASGICGSDTNFRLNEGIGFPNVLGHEGSGIVEKVGSAVTEVEEGDHVILSFSYCGQCHACSHGKPSMCDYYEDYNKNDDHSVKNREEKIKNEEGDLVSSMFNQSSFATYSLTDETNVIKIDKDLDLRLMGPLACGLATGTGAVKSTLQPTQNEGIAVFGTGAVGFGAIMTAKNAGCYPIVAVDIVDSRLETAEELGATHTFNNESDDPVEFLKDLTDGVGVEYAIDTTGVESVLRAALDSLAKAGTLVPIALGGELSLETYPDITNQSKAIKGSLMGDSVPKYNVADMIENYRKGDFPFDKLVKFYDFEEINQAEADSASGEVIKPIVIVDKEYQPN